MTTENLERNVTRPVVFLQHGELDSADAWVVRPTNSSAIDAVGFGKKYGNDVWLSNSRGSKYSHELENSDCHVAFRFDS